MIEVIYKEDKGKAQGNEQFFHIPKNIRQIGLIGGEHKIYIEDYAYTFLGRIASERPMKGKMAVLLGQSNWSEGTSYIFVRCVLQVQEEVSPEHLPLSDESWIRIHEQMEEFFQGQEIVGWFFSAPEIPMEVTDVIYRTHTKFFGGNDKVLFLMEPQEKEEAFFRYDNGRMARQTGYYIYYEKNPLMQEYMIAMNQDGPEKISETVPDDAVVSFRRKIQQKQEKQQESQKKMSGVMYAASACAALAVLAVGINFINQYDKMQQAAKQVQEQTAETFAYPTQETEPEETPAGESEEVKEEVTVLEKETDEDSDEEKERTSPKPTEKPVSEKPQTDASRASSGKQEDSEAKSSETAGRQAYESYVIRPGDTLFKISVQKYGDMSEIEEICRLNGISEDDIIYPGQTILLP